jgi:hypothetical protein
MFKDLMNANNRQALYSSQMKNIEDELTPFGFIDNGQSTEPDVEVVDGDIWLSDKYQKDYSDFIKERIPNLGDTVYDVMIEAKAKDLALIEYRNFSLTAV